MYLPGVGTLTNRPRGISEAAELHFSDWLVFQPPKPNALCYCLGPTDTFPLRFSRHIPKQATMRQRKPKEDLTRRRPVSCHFCRSRKLRCNRHFPCPNCVSRGIECKLYGPGPTKASSTQDVPGKHDSELLARLQRLEDMVMSHNTPEKALHTTPPLLTRPRPRDGRRLAMTDAEWLETEGVCQSSMVSDMFQTVPKVQFDK